MTDAAPTPKPDTNRRRAIVAVPIGVAFLLAVLARPAWLGAAPKAPGDDAHRPDAAGFSISFGGQGPQVDVQRPNHGRVSEAVHAPASIRSGGETSVGAPFEGRISELCVDEGDVVTENQVIFRLDPADWDQKKNEAELELARRKAAVVEADAELREADHRFREAEKEPSTLTEARLKVPQAELGRQRAVAQLETAQSRLARAQEMLDQKVGKQEDVDTALAERRAQEIALKIAEGDLALAKESLGFREREWLDAKATALKALDTARTHVDRCRADLRAGEVAVARATRDREKCDIRTPIAGIVTQRSVNDGELVGRGDGRTADTTHYIVSDMRKMYAYADVDEGDVTKVAPKQVAHVRVNAIGDEVNLKGSVVDVGNRAQQASGSETKSFRVRILLSTRDERLRPGMSASVEIETRTTAEEALRVPLMAISHKPRKEITGEALVPEHPTNGGTTTASRKLPTLDEVDVAWVVKDDKVEPRIVQLGASDGEWVQVLSGVDTEDWLVLGPYRVLESLKKGDHVRMQKKEPPAATNAAPATTTSGTSGTAPATSETK